LFLLDILPKLLLRFGVVKVGMGWDEMADLGFCSFEFVRFMPN